MNIRELKEYLKELPNEMPVLFDNGYETLDDPPTFYVEDQDEKRGPFLMVSPP